MIVVVDECGVRLNDEDVDLFEKMKVIVIDFGVEFVVTENLGLKKKRYG